MSKVTTTTPTTPTTQVTPKATKTTKKVVKVKETVEDIPKTSTTATTPVTTTPVTTTPVTTTPVTTTTPPVETETESTESMKQRFENMIKSRQTLLNDIRREIQDLKKMQRDHEVAIKEASKRSKKKKVVSEENSNRKPSGFASPVTVSDELYSFLSQFGVKKGEAIARTDVTKYITTYIKDKDLQNPEHRREIVPDAALKKLFGPAIEPKDPNDANSPLVYTYLKLQRYLSPHFPKRATA